MSDQEMSLIMRIRSMFDGGGAKEATDAQGKLVTASKAATDATGQGSKALGQAGQVAGRAAEQIGTVAGAMGSAGGAAGQAAAGVRLLSGAIQTMTTAGGGLAGLLAAVALLATSALVNWLVKVSGETKNLNEQAKKTNDVLTSMGKITFDAITAQQEKLRKSASDTADQYERILAAKNRMASAQEQADLAQLDYEKSVDLSKASRSDPFASRRIEAEYAAKAAAVSQEAERSRQNNEVAIAESKVNDLRTQAAISDNEVARKSAVKANAIDGLENMKRGMNVTSMTDEDRKLLATQIGNLEMSISEMTKAIEADQAKADQSRQQLPSAELDVLTARTVRAGNDIRNRATGMQGRNTISDINYDTAEERERTIRELRDKKDALRDGEREQDDLRKRTFKEYGDIRTAREKPIDLHGKQTESSYLQAKDDHDKAVAKELEEWKGFAKTLKETDEKRRQAAADIRRDIERLNAKLENMPGQSN